MVYFQVTVPSFSLGLHTAVPKRGLMVGARHFVSKRFFVGSPHAVPEVLSVGAGLASAQKFLCRVNSKIALINCPQLPKGD